MKTLGIKPNEKHISLLMTAYARDKNLDKVLELHKKAGPVYGLNNPCLQRMTAIILAYCRTGQPEQAEKLIKEMREEMGLEPDVVCYTTLIHGYRGKRNYDKVWELYDECHQKRLPGQDIDEQLMSYMIGVCSKTHDSERAIRIFNDLELDGFLEHSKPYNSIMMACASTHRYAPKAIEYWHLMSAKNI